MEDSRLDSRTSPRHSLWPVSNCCPMMQSLASASLDFPANQSTPVGGARQLTLVNSTEGRRGFKSKTHPLLSSTFSLFLFFFFFAPPALRFACAARKGKSERRERKVRKGRVVSGAERAGTRKEVGGYFGHSCHGAFQTGLLHTSDSR